VTATHVIVPDPATFARLPLAPGEVALWWLGQSSFFVRGPTVTILVDPFLSDHPDRLVPPPFAAAEVVGVDVVAITHDHLDHLDDEAVAALANASPTATFVVPEPVVERVMGLGVDGEHVVGAQPDVPVELAGVRIDPVPAAHGDEPADAYGFGFELSGGLHRYLGYVFDLDGVRLYHAGDTILYDGIESRLAALRVDVALLPINGRDADREAQGIVGNLDEEEAVRLAAAIGADVLVPMHYEMFAANLGSPERVVALARLGAPETAVVVLAHGRVFVYTRPEEAGSPPGNRL
jgi:L-ascorbate 6-phosphate lactonase